MLLKIFQRSTPLFKQSITYVSYSKPNTETFKSAEYLQGKAEEATKNIKDKAETGY